MVRQVKPVGFGGKPLKSELHHWWPRALSKLWEDADGKVTRVSWDGSVLRAPSKTFGAITNAHHLNVGAPWSASIEPIFGDADSALPGLARKLELLAYSGGKGPEIDNRITPHGMEVSDRKMLGECLASLLVRCPAHRNMLHLTTESFWGRTGDEVHKHNDTLIAANIYQHYKNVVSSLASGGKIILMRSGEREFIMGEGYLSTLVGINPETQYHCLIPLTPTLAVCVWRGSRCWTEPPICTIGLTPNEVDVVNAITQVYTRDYLFFRSQAPTLIDGFRIREFRICQYHQVAWLEAIMHAVGRYLPPTLRQRSSQP